MAHDPDSNTADEHSVELTAEPEFRPSRRRRVLAALGAAVCLGGAIMILGLAGVRAERTHEVARVTESTQREALLKNEQIAVAAAAQAADLAAESPPATPVSAPAASGSAPPTPIAPPARSSTSASPSRRHSSTSDAPAMSNSDFHLRGSATDSDPGAADLVLPSATPRATGSDIPGENSSNGNAPGAVPNPALPRGAAPSPGMPGENSNSTSDLP